MPGLGATRVPARSAMFVRLGLSVLAAVGVGAMEKAPGRTTWRGLAVARDSPGPASVARPQP